MVYEADARLGGRCFSNRTLVPGMACENGGELIDTGHKTMLAYASGMRGAALRQARLQQQVSDFLTDFDIALPGTGARAATSGGRCVAHLEHWPTNPGALGSYTCYTPGQFTAVAGLEGEPAGLLKFAGEHTDSFYSWQGFIEGACVSGIRAANELLAEIKSGAL
jgi:monoamine oxidase